MASKNYETVSKNVNSLTSAKQYAEQNSKVQNGEDDKVRENTRNDIHPYGENKIPMEEYEPEAKQFASYFKKIEVFGHFESSLLAELYKHVEVKDLKVNEVLFQPLDVDDSIYIVLSGSLLVDIEWNGTRYPVKTVRQEDSVFSLLSILKALTGSQEKFKTVRAKAETESKVLKLRSTLFVDVFEQYPESWTRVVQLIAWHVQHVIFDTLHSFLGLTKELLNPIFDQEKFKKTSAEKPETGHQSNPVAAAETERKSKEFFLELATSAYAKFFGFNKAEESWLLNKVDVLCYPAGFIVCEQGSADCSMYFIITGSIEFLQKTLDETESAEVVISKARRLEFVSVLHILTGEASFYTLKTGHQTRLAVIKRKDVYDLIKRKPQIVLRLAYLMVNRLSPFVRQVDFALSLMLCEAGEPLFKQNEKADAIYLVLNGRLRAVTTNDSGEKQVVGEFGRSDIIGMLEMFTPHKLVSSTIEPVRSTTLAKIPDGLLNFIKQKYPHVLIRLVKLMSKSMARQQEESLTGKLRYLSHVGNLNTIAIFAVSNEVPLLSFSLELWHALNSIMPTLRLSEEVVEKYLGPSVLQKGNEFRLLGWLNQQEEAYSRVLYQCNYAVSQWTQRCIYQADCILIVANGRSSPALTKVELKLEKLSAHPQKLLVLLWPKSVATPYNTTEWLKTRPWIASHYHVQLNDRLFSSKHSEEHLLRMYEKFSQPADKLSDFSRLARVLTGTSVGLVLGGGGARGASHVGVIRALTEAGMTIDVIGGTSIGSFIGGLYCCHPNWKIVDAKARQWFAEMSPILPKLLDLTYPHTAMFTGSTFNTSLQKIFEDVQIENLWIPYFNITTDVTTSEMRIIRHGPLWRYCRASMSLAGYLPPIPSLDDGHMLLDGGYVNNLPADVMRTMFGVATILAVDVGSRQDNVELTDYGDSLSGFWVLWKKYAPLVERVNVLDMAEVQARLSYVSCVHQLEAVKRAPYCYYIRPPIDNYATLDFHLYEEIYGLGYVHGKNCCDNWMKTGKLDEVFSSQIVVREDENQDDKVRHQADYFTDLADIIATPSTPIYESRIDESISVEEDVAMLDLAVRGKTDKPKIMEEFSKDAVGESSSMSKVDNGINSAPNSQQK